MDLINKDLEWFVATLRGNIHHCWCTSAIGYRMCNIIVRGYCFTSQSLGAWTAFMCCWSAWNVIEAEQYEIWSHTFSLLHGVDHKIMTYSSTRSFGLNCITCSLSCFQNCAELSNVSLKCQGCHSYCKSVFTAFVVDRLRVLASKVHCVVRYPDSCSSW